MSNWSKLKQELLFKKRPNESCLSECKRSLKDKKVTSFKRKSDYVTDNDSDTCTTTKKPKLDLWFDDCAVQTKTGKIICKDTKINSKGSSIPSLQNDVKALITSSDTSITKCIAIDCEMVGAGTNRNNQYDMLARCSIVNCYGNVVYDKYVTPVDNVVDYRTKYSGITDKDLRTGTVDLSIVQKEVSETIKDKRIVGHGLHHDFKVLFLSHPSRNIRDTATYPPFKALAKGKRPSLKRLAETHLGLAIQQGSHDSVQDARVAMKLYQLNKNDWEKHVMTRKKALKKNRVVMC